MFESKVSTVRSAWGEFSSINHSNAPGFVPIPCPSHQDYSITNICKSPGCIEPLCPECITEHVQLHQQTKKPAKIQNIITTRLTVIEQLAKLKFQAEQQLEQYKKDNCGNIQEYVEAQMRKLDVGEKKLLKLIEDTFQELRKNMEIVSAGYLAQKQKKERQIHSKLSPLTNYITQVTEYKGQLESDDYIPALIELLNQPPRKPKLQTIEPVTSCGGVEVNESYFEDIKKNLSRFINVEVKVKDEGKVNMARSNYHGSNNMKFSRFDRSRSRQGSESRLRSTSRSKIFALQTQQLNTSRTNKDLPSTPTTTSIFNNYEKTMQITMGNYFLHDGFLIYFRQNTKHYYRAELNYIEAGFDKVELDIKFLIPQNHRTIITPSCEVFIIGGQKTEGISNKVYNLHDKCYLRQASPMQENRTQFGCCYGDGYIYVAGGLQNVNSSRRVSNHCERYSISTKRWQRIKNLPQGAYNFQLCAFNNQIYKFGGITQRGQHLFKIDIYDCQRDEWRSVELDHRVELNYLMGCIQISHDSLAIFGGYDAKGSKSAKCYVFTHKNGLLQIFVSTQLYNTATFQNCFLHRGTIFAIQDGQNNRSKLIMNYRHEQWKFIAC